MHSAWLRVEASIIAHARPLTRDPEDQISMDQPARLRWTCSARASTLHRKFESRNSIILAGELVECVG
jgi:hypothetical protein